MTGCAGASAGATVTSAKVPEDAELRATSDGDKAFVVPGRVD